MNILLIGAEGRMGRMVRESAERNDIIFPVEREVDLTHCENVDVVVDFSTCTNRSKYIAFARKNKLPYACFSTNLSKEDKVGFKKLSAKVPVLICPNASLGVNALFEMVEIAAKLEAEATITETHHKNKLDKPSGTAKRIERILEENNTPFSTECFRVGEECGEHCVRFYFQDEILEVKHYAKSRKIFAIGALKMAQKLKNQKCGMFDKI